MVEMNSSSPRTKQQRSQPAVYQLHQVQDLRFLTTHTNKLTQAVQQGQRLDTQQQQAGGEESWLKEVRKVKRVEK
jgi:hypothetical protein